MRTAIAAKLCLGLLLLALLLPVQIYSQNATTVPSITNTSMSTTILITTKQTPNKTTSTSSTTSTIATTSTTAATTGSGNSLQSTASLFIISLSVLHLYC